MANHVPAERRCLLLFGAITERKGVLALLDALALLPEVVARRTAIMLAGRIEPAIRSEIEGKCQRLAALQPALWLKFEDRRLTAGELGALVRRAVSASRLHTSPA